jgi:nucleotide-binding universal stress UspA family protein
MYRHILVPTDGSPLSLKAAKAAAGLARGLGAKITAIYVVEPFEPHWVGEIRSKAPDPLSAREMDKLARERAEAALEKVAALAGKSGIPCARLVVSDANPWKAIVKTAQAKKCDLIAMSSHGRRGLESILLGSQTTKVLAQTKLPVLVCR